MKAIKWLALLAGIAIFAVSFTLPAVKEASAGPDSAGIKGYTCAIVALQMPWNKEGLKLLHDSPLEYFSILLSGWINPAFLVALFFVLIRPDWLFTAVLRYAVVLMFGFCWVIFMKHHLHPQQGYYLWMSGVLLALFANKFSKA